MMEQPKLTARQQQILDLIQSAIARTGAPPTRAEIAKELGFRSANAAEEHLQALAREGAIEIFPGTSRGIRLLSIVRAVENQLEISLKARYCNRRANSRSRASSRSTARCTR